MIFVTPYIVFRGLHFELLVLMKCEVGVIHSLSASIPHIAMLFCPDTSSLIELELKPETINWCTDSLSSK